MNFLFGLHGAVAIVLLCTLLFVEEAGVPVPFAPGELTLLAGGLLIAAGGLDPFIFVPLAIVVCVAGATVGFSWARIVGEHGLVGLAAKFHQHRALERVSIRIRMAGPVGIAVSRLIPGLRIYTTLVAGAFGVRRRTFIAGMVPSTAIWVVVYVAVGVVAGIPVEHFLTHLAKLAVQGAILLVIGLGGYLAIRRAPDVDRQPLVHLPGGLRTALAVLVDVGVVASVLTGLLAIVRRVTETDFVAGWADVAVVVAAVGALYLFLTRRGAGATVGEALLHTGYLRRRSEVGGPGHGSPGGWAHGQLQATADVLRALGSVPRLAVLRSLLEGAVTVGEVAGGAELSYEETDYHLAVLVRAGVVATVSLGGQEVRYGVQERMRDWVSELLTKTAAAPPDSAGLP
jgi:membrane protein DedA with SNARE-associated domain/DNA-binding transcriptional ArsR family regulator